MGTISLYVNHKETIDLCTKYNCLDSELNKVVKATLLDNKSSRYFREVGKVEMVEIDRAGIIEEYLRTTPVGIIIQQRSEATNKPVFTLDLECKTIVKT